MASSIPPIGGPKGQSPIDPMLSQAGSSEAERDFETIPEIAGQPISKEQVVLNCELLSRSALPENLSKVVIAAKEAGGKVPIGPLVTSAKNSEMLAAMFASISNLK